MSALEGYKISTAGLELEKEKIHCENTKNPAKNPATSFSSFDPKKYYEII